jgi:alkylation response protein AidB-like acyl-CoA dehydrogenase
MDFVLSEAHAEIRDRARRIAEAEIAPRARDADREEKFPLEQMRHLAKNGLLAMLASRAYGGGELGSIAYSLAMTEISRACASTAVTMAVTNMVADAIAAFGDERQKKRFIPGLASAELTAGAFALSEAGSGSDAAGMKTTAKKHGDRYVIEGSKCWITSGDHAGVLLVMARTDPSAGSRGISAFLVEPSMKGFSVGRHEDKMGLRGSSTVTINLDAVEVPEESRLGPEGIGFRIAMRALDGGRIGVASQALGIGVAALESSVRYANASGIGAQESIQWRLADMASELDAARLLTLRAASLKDLGRPFTREASMAKVFATEAANRAALQAIEIHGSEGSIDRQPVERYLRDVRVTMIYEGTSEIQRVVIARQILAPS